MSAEAGGTPKKDTARASGSAEPRAGQPRGVEGRTAGPRAAEGRTAEPLGAQGRAAGSTEGLAAGSAEGRAAGSKDTAAEAEEPILREAEQTVRDAISAPDAAGRPRRTSRRFPRITRDTARPEGGGRAAAGDAPAPVRQWPILTVLAAVGLGLLLTALDVFRYGTILIGAALLAGAVMRWVLPDVGMLAVRSRFTDMLTYGALGLAIMLLAMMAQPNPWLEIPFLKDTLHYTVRS